MKKDLAIIIFSVIISGAVFSYLFIDNKKTQENAVKVQGVLEKGGMSKDLYEKESNKFCIKVEDAAEQERIAEDMAWMVELNQTEIRKIEIVDCENGKGIMIK